MDDDVANTLTMTAEEYAEERVRQAIHFAGLPYGMTMLRHAFRRGEIRLKDVVDAQEMPLGAAGSICGGCNGLGCSRNDTHPSGMSFMS